MNDLRQAAQQALEALEYASTGNRRPEIIGPAITALKAALGHWDIGEDTPDSLSKHPAFRRAPKQPAEPECWCHKCSENTAVVNNIPFSMTRMIVCPTCGNKRCPKASDHRLDCTDSNAAGQPGSVYPAPPKQQAEPVPEPVATVTVMTQGVRRNYSFQALQKLPDGVNNLYTAPPQRKPLTEEEITNIVRKVSKGSALRPMNAEPTSVRIARATEAAHGIKEGT